MNAALSWTERAAVTVPEAAHILSLTEKAMYARIARGEIPTLNLGRRKLVPVAWLVEQRNHGKAA